MQMNLYETIAPYYHLIYPNWEQAIERHARILGAVIRSEFPRHDEIHDVSCGIGTQILGLAKTFTVSGSDLSAASIARAKTEAASRGLNIRLGQADMRDLRSTLPDQSVDIVLSADNSLPHLQNDEDILAALSEFHRVSRTGGGALITIRDYETEDFANTFRPYGKRVGGGKNYYLFQSWEVAATHYDVSLYVVEDDGTSCRTIVGRDRYYPITTDKLVTLLKRAGFSEARRIDGEFYQPVIVARK